MNPIKQIKSKMLANLEKLTTRAFALAYDAVSTPETKNHIANARKAIKLFPLAPHILKSRFMSDEKPFILHHWVTLRCNCSCESCLWKDNKAEAMATNEIKKFHRSAAEEGFIGALIGGGEPLLREDIPEIYRYAKQKCGWKIATATNGFFLEDRIGEFGDYIDALLVSVDSANPEKHDKIRGVNGLFARVISAIEKVKSKYPFIYLLINTCVDDNNLDEMMDIIQLTIVLNVPLSIDVITTTQNIGHDGATDKKSHLITSYHRIAEALHDVLEAKKTCAKIFNSKYYLTHFDNGKQPYRCRYPRIFLRLMPNGEVEDCLHVGNPIANVRTTPLKKILKMDRMKTLQKNAKKCYICSSPTMIEYSHFWENPLELFKSDSPLMH